MDPKELFKKAIYSAAGCAVQVRADEYQEPTPCSEWNLKQLLNHLIYELVWMPPLLEGKTIQEIGDQFEGNLLGDNPVAAWKKAAKAASDAVDKVDLDAVVHVSYGDIPARQYIMEMANDVLIHGWDVGQSIHCSVLFEEPVAQAIYDHMAPNMKAYRDGGFIGAEIPMSEDTNIRTKLLAIMGRREQG